MSRPPWSTPPRRNPNLNPGRLEGCGLGAMSLAMAFIVAAILVAVAWLGGAFG